jgi:glycosyltransferase involved in cell wall biosynthesis
MTRICLVCDVFHPSEESTSQLFTELLVTLAEDGIGFDVVTNRLPQTPAAPGLDSALPAGVRVHAVGIPIQGRGSLVLRGVRNAAFVLGAAIRMLWLKTDRFWASTNPPFTPLWVAPIARLRRRPFDIVVHDVYPDGLVAVGYLREGSFLARVWRALNRRAYRQAAKIVVLGRDMAQVIQERYGVPGERLVLFPNWSPFDQSSPPALAESHLARRLALTDRFVVQYSGNMGLWHDIDTIVEAAALLADLPNVRFLMIGGGRRKARAMKLAAERGVGSMTWLDFQPRTSLSDSLACASVALISQRNGLEGMAVPCKLYGILASGRAIVAAVPHDCEVAHVVREHDCGVVLPPDDPQALANAIRFLASSQDDVRAMGSRAFAAYQERYSLAAARSRYWQEWGRQPCGSSS